MTKAEAKELSLEVWRYLAEHPETEKKRDLPADIIYKIKKFFVWCPLCELFNNGEDNCSGCPLDDDNCKNKGSLYELWDFSPYGEEGNKRRAKAARKTAVVPKNQRVKVLVLYGGAGGYRTINKNDISHHYLSAAGGVNLAADYTLGGRNMGGVIDFETIVSFKPEVIFSAGPTDRLEILKEPALAEVPAVKNGRVYACPKGIFVWYARSAEGAMLPLWFGTKLYPELFQDINMATVVRDYFANFYNYNIPDEELRVVLNLTSSDSLGPGQ